MDDDRAQVMWEVTSVHEVMQQQPLHLYQYEVHVQHCCYSDFVLHCLLTTLIHLHHCTHTRPILLTVPTN